MAKAWAFWLVVLGALALAVLTVSPPRPRAAATPVGDFSAERAMTVVHDIARAPHPIGSAEHDRVRDALTARLEALGFDAMQIPGSAVRKTDDGYVGADVTNILGVLKGRDRAKPGVLLMAHYDSVPGSPAAADDSAGVASVLEAARALKARGPQARDLVVLLTDGEETGLFGAQAAFADPARGAYDLRRIGAVINLETRGSSGPAFMFETGRDNAGVIGAYARAVDRPAANSLTGWVYDRMPNGSDFTVPKTLGLPGVNIAFIGRPFDYHSPSATPANLDRRSLQHMGDQTLEMAQAFLTHGPGARGPDLVYADVFGRWLLAYPAWGGWLLLMVCGGLIGFAAQREGLPEQRLDALRGVGLLMLLLVWPALVLHLAWRLAPTGPDFYQSATGARFDVYFAGMALLAAGMALGTVSLAARGKARWIAAGAALVAGLLCSARGGFDVEGAVLGVAASVLFAAVLGRPLDPRGATQGLLIGGLLLGLLLQALAPGIAFLIVWPLLGAAVTAAILAAMAPSLVRDLIAAAMAAVFLGWVLRMAAPLFDGLGLSNPELLGLFTLIGAMLVTPFLLGWVAWGKGGHWTAFACSIGGVALIAFVALSPPWTARTPRPSHVLYVADQTTGKARVVSVGGELDPWGRGVLASHGPVQEGSLPLLFADHVWWAPAGPSVPIEARDVSWSYPVAASARPRPTGTDLPGDPSLVWSPSLARNAPLTIAMPYWAGARDLKVTLTFSSDVTATDEAMGFSTTPIGFSDPVQAGRPYRVRWYAPASGPGFYFSFRSRVPHGSVRVQWAALRDGWPAGARPLPSRPANVMAMNSSDATVITGEQTLRW
ncbi:MAG: M20/M25/M40 family metallo-hydrolase [Caulobacteraceae bacterium]|nr:M20/M25/M40 family metallo-hydrolase [Caulobacteraceae bacterium]